GNVSFLPAWTASFLAAALLDLALVRDRADRSDLYIKDLFDRGFDLGLGCFLIDTKSQNLTGLPVVVFLGRIFLEDHAFFRDDRRFQYFPNVIHPSPPPHLLLSSPLVWLEPSQAFRPTHLQSSLSLPVQPRLPLLPWLGQRRQLFRRLSALRLS